MLQVCDTGIQVQNYQRKVLELEQLERLYELQQQGLINYDTGM